MMTRVELSGDTRTCYSSGQKIMFQICEDSLCSTSSDSSVVEIEPPKKKTPPVVDIVDDGLILNLSGRTKNVYNDTPDVLLGNTNTCHANRLVSHNEIMVEGNNPTHWTPDMITFYNDDWGDEDKFIVEKLQEKMDRSPSLWEVSQKDLYFAQNKRMRSRFKCINCRQYGHPTNKCTEPFQIQKCYMCGEPGHNNRRCPNSLCLNCGNRMRRYVTCCHKCVNESKIQCTRCLLWGHHFINCSDNWRRFHLTVGKAEVHVPQETPYKNAKEIWCCNCGSKGHHQVHCLIKDNFQFPDTFPFVSSYDTSFNNEPIGRREVPTKEGKVGYFRKIRNLFSSKHKKLNAYRDKKNADLGIFLNSNKKKKKKKNKKKKGESGMLFLNSNFI